MFPFLLLCITAIHAFGVYIYIYAYSRNTLREKEKTKIEVTYKKGIKRRSMFIYSYRDIINRNTGILIGLNPSQPKKKYNETNFPSIHCMFNKKEIIIDKKIALNMQRKRS
jgi:hypothetical protein